VRLVSMADIVGATGWPVHRVRWLLRDRGIIASSERTKGNAHLWHPWVIPWLKQYTADKQAIKERMATRTAELIRLIEKEKGEANDAAQPTDFGLAPLCVI